MAVRQGGPNPRAGDAVNDIGPEGEESCETSLRRSRWSRLAALRHHKAVKHSSFFALEAVATLLALVLCVLGMSWWWLSQGPAEVPLIRQHVEAELREARNGRPVDIDRVELSWTAQRGLQLLAADVVLRDAQGRPISASREVSIGISPWHLLIGQIRLTRADFVGGEVTVTRARDGATNIVFGPPGAAPDLVLPAPPPNESLNARVNRVLDGFAAALRPVGAGGRMRSISISDAHLVIIDDQGGGRWAADAATLQLAREGSNLSFFVRARLEGPRGPAPAALRITTDTRFRAARIEFSANGARPRAILSPAVLGMFAALDAPMNATIRVGLDRREGITQLDGDVSLGRGSVQLEGGRFAIEGGRVHGAYDLSRDQLTVDQISLAGARTQMRGAIRVANASSLLRADRPNDATFAANMQSITLHVPGVFPEPVSLGAVNIAGRVNRAADAIEFQRFEAGIGAARLNLTGRIFWAAASDGRTHPGATFAGRVTGPVNVLDVVHLWPLQLAEGARDYLGDAVIGGRLTDVAIRGDIRPDDTAAGVLRDEALNVSFNFDGAHFRYIDTMSPVTAGRGRAVLQGNRFDLWMDDARIEGLAVSQAHVELPRLSPRGAMATVTARAEGDARGFVTLLRQQPIGLEGRLPVQPDTVVGRGVVTLVLQRPMLSNVPFEDLRFTVSGEFQGVGGMERDGRLRFADGRLTVRGDQRAVTVSGPVRAGDSNTSIQWVETMTRGVATPSRYQISGDFDAMDLQRLGYPITEVALGRVGVTLRGAGRGYDVDSANVALDFRNATVTLPRNIWTKRPGQPGTARFDVARGDDGGLTLSAIELRGANLNASQGEVRLARDNRFIRATFPRVQINDRSDARINIERASDGAYVYDVSGAFFDAQPWMDEDPAAVQRAAQPQQAGATPRETPAPIRGRVRVERLGMRQGVALANARVEFSVVNDALTMLTAQGADPQGGSFTMGLGPRPDNPQGRITMRAEDAGFAARALTGSENVRGGAATADGTWAAAPMRAQFTVRMRDFTAVRVPAMARLLGSVASLRGMVDMLDGDGITFSSLEAPVVMTPGRLTIGESRASGPSIGITATGTYDTRRDNLDIDGVIVPSYGLNSMLGNVPIIGNLFRSREGEGLFGMTYSMNGPIANARVGVNPLSALTPGIFRRIFEPASPRNRAQTPAPPAAPARTGN